MGSPIDIVLTNTTTTAAAAITTTTITMSLYGTVVSKHDYISWGPGFNFWAKLPTAV